MALARKAAGDVVLLGHHLNEFLSCRKAEAPGGIDSFELMKAITQK